MWQKLLDLFVCVNSGTTDNPCEVTDNPTPSEKEIQFILQEIRNYLSPDVNGMYWYYYVQMRYEKQIYR